MAHEIRRTSRARKQETLSEGVASRGRRDTSHSAETRRRTLDAAERLLREVEEFVRNSPRKPGT